MELRLGIFYVVAYESFDGSIFEIFVRIFW